MKLQRFLFVASIAVKKPQIGRDDRSRTCLNLLPKQAGDRYPTSRYSVFLVKSVSGQICGQKFFAETHGGGKARKREKNGDFASFRRSAHEAVTRSQTSRATSCATPRYDILHLHIIAFFCAYVKSKNRKRMFRFFCSKIGKHDLFIKILHLFRFKIYKPLYK